MQACLVCSEAMAMAAVVLQSQLVVLLLKPAAVPQPLAVSQLAVLLQLAAMQIQPAVLLLLPLAATKVAAAL
jgi:hypothetical protein